VLQKAHPARTGVHLYVDGRHVATEFTGQVLPPAIAARVGNAPQADAGFAFALPRSVLDGFEHNIHVAVPHEHGESLHGEVFSFKSSPVRGEVRQQARLFVGTVWFDALPRSAARLLVTGEGGVVLHRQELKPAAVPQAQGYPAPFSIDPEEWPDGPLHFSVEGQALRGSPCRRGVHPLGMVEGISVRSIRGWAFDAADPKQPIELLLRIDGRHAAWFRPYVRRPDIAQQIGFAQEDWGLVGFEVATPSELLDGEPHRVEVVLADGGQTLSKGLQVVQLPAVGTPWKSPEGGTPSTTPAGFPLRGQPLPRLDTAPVVSAVVLTRNGEGLLQAFLQSWALHMKSVPSEIIVVDHASTDGTLALLRRWQAHLPLKVIALDHNGSFSASCNLGAAQARGEYLLFANNDIVWLQDSLPRLVETLRDPQVGIAGLKLLKIVGESRDGSQHATEVQHLGVRFKLNEKGYWPYEAGPSSRNREAEHTAQAVPAVTGAAMMCRRGDFDAVGGFDATYFYGFEDVELCLRLAYRLRKAVVCRNDCVALHHHGHTRLSGRELSIYDRLMRNSAVLQGHIGVWIKQAYWRSLLLSDGYITSEPMCIGIVVDADPAAGTTPLVQAAKALARQLAAAMPRASIVLLDPARGWKGVAGLHVLVVGDPRYDIRTLQDARPDLLTVAWVLDDAKAWPRLPWWNDYGTCVAAPALAPRVAALTTRKVHRVGAGQPLGEALGTRRWRMRVAIHAAPATMGQAQALRDSLQRADMPCWVVPLDEWGSHPMMADVCITLWDGDRPEGPQPVLRTDVINVMWLVSGKGRAPVQADAPECLVTQTMPRADWLEQEMEKRIGSTFSSP
jgi:GT2 family glycosyltransferase